MLITAGIGALILGVVMGFNLTQTRGEQGWRAVPYVGLVPTGPPPKLGQPPPDFQLSYFRIPAQGDTEIGTFRLSEQRGKPVWLNFWATWCPPCRAEMPDIQKVWQEVEGEVVFLGIDFAENPTTVADYIVRNGFTFPIGLDLDAKVSTEYRLAGLPTHFFIDRNGILREIRIGLLSVEGMKTRLEKLKGY